jgi:serine phosphatase RsbU (regulator of sigma subunit)
MVRLVRIREGQAPREGIEAKVAGVEDFVGTGPQNNDMTVIALRIG